MQLMKMQQYMPVAGYAALQVVADGVLQPGPLHEKQPSLTNAYLSCMRMAGLSSSQQTLAYQVAAASVSGCIQLP